MKRNKNLVSFLLFIGLVCLTFLVLFRDNRIEDVILVWSHMDPVWIILALGFALLFVSGEGFLIWYLLRVQKNSIGLGKCIGYSFIGFFFSGITPSATGGQPIQLYYMSKDKLKLSDSTVVLMTIAILYKLVLVCMGLGIGIFCYKFLMPLLGTYWYLYWFGLGLNIIVTAILIFIMVSPNSFQRILLWGERLLVKLHFLKPLPERKKCIHKMAEEYRDNVRFLLENKKHIVVATVITFLQRICLFLPTYFVYRGMGLQGESALSVILLQASVYVAVDMLPLPGAQGITEMMYGQVFVTIFTGQYLISSLCATRGINFYFLLIVSGIVAAVRHLKVRGICDKVCKA